MRWRLLVLSLVLLLACMSAPIAATNKSGLSFVDVSTGMPIAGGLVRVEGNQTIEFFVTESYPGPEQVPGGLLLVKTAGNKTFNYYALQDGTRTTIPVHPAGLVQGEVVDQRASFIVHTPLTINCPTFATSVSTDATGQFRVVLPAEECMFAVAANGRVGNAALRVPQGDVAALTLNVTSPIGASRAASPAWMLILIVAVVFAAAAGIILFHRRRFKRRKETGAIQGAQGETPKDAPAFVAQDVKGVLKEKERLIVDELLLRSGKMTLRELRFNTQLPRTSLLRTIESLETRGIVLKKEEHGRLIVELVAK